MNSAPKFRVVILKHGYPSIENERRIVTAAGGELINGEEIPEVEGLRQCGEADGVLVRWLKITPDLIKRWPRCRPAWGVPSAVG